MHPLSAGLQFIFRAVVCFLQIWNLLILGISTFWSIINVSFLFPPKKFGVLKSDFKLYYLQKCESVITPVKSGLHENNWEFTHSDKWHTEFYIRRLLMCINYSCTVYLCAFKLLNSVLLSLERINSQSTFVVKFGASEERWLGFYFAS